MAKLTNAVRPVRAITLDLDDTLWDFAPVIARAEQALYKTIRDKFPRVAKHYAVKDMQSVRQEVLQKNSEISYDLTEIRRLTFNKMLSECGYEPENSKILLEQYLTLRHEVEFFADAIPALDRLSNLCPLLALTNGNADVTRLGIAHFFKGYISAYSARMLKPDPRIFGLACKTLGEVPECVLHIGDNPVDDVLGALDAGLQAVWVNRRGNNWTWERKPHVEVDNLIDLVELLEVQD